MTYSEKSSNGRSPQETVDRALRGTSSYDSAAYRPGPPMLPAPIPAMPPEERKKVFKHLKEIKEALKPAVEYEDFTFIRKGPVPTIVFESGQTKAGPKPEVKPQAAKTISKPEPEKKLEPTHVEPTKEKILQHSNDFISGFALNLPKPHKVIWRNAAKISLLSRSQKQSERKLIKETVGTAGKIIDSPVELKIYFPSPAYDFLSGGIDNSIYEDKSRFASFTLGILMFLSEKQNRISNHDIENFRKIVEKFEEHFGFSMGRFTVEKRKERKDIGIITIPQMTTKKVFETLLTEPAVIDLPFFPGIARYAREKILTLSPAQGI